MNLSESLDEVCEIEPQQKLLLEALILPSPRDEESFLRWLAVADFESMDTRTLRLVPPLFAKFGAATRGLPYRKRLKGIYRYFHFRTSLVYSAGRPVIERMLADGIDVLLFKGIAVAIKYHAGMATRPMMDMDVLVRPD